MRIPPQYETIAFRPWPRGGGPRSLVLLPPAGATPTPHGAGRLSFLDEIALRAYFNGLDREARGEPGAPQQDWQEAEQQLALSPV